MHLVTHALSPYSAKVRIALREKGLAFDDERLAIARAGIVRKPEALLAANPRGAVERARVRLLEDDADWLMNGAIAELLAETYGKPDPATRDEARLAAAAAAIRAAHGRLERALADGRPYLGGEAFTLADAAWLLPVSFAAFYGVAPEDAQPRLREWLLRVSARPSVAEETKAMREALAALPD